MSLFVQCQQTCTTDNWSFLSKKKSRVYKIHNNTTAAGAGVQDILVIQSTL